MRKAAVLLLSTAAVMMVVGILVTQSLLVMQRVAAVEDVQGMVWVRQRGHDDFMPLADRPRVAAGDTIRTDGRSRVDLHYVDGTRFRVGPNTRVTVLKSQYNGATGADTQMFKLDLGRVWIRVLKVLSQKSKFEVVTPSATAGVRGTIFSVAVSEDGQTVVSVKEGKVAVRHESASWDVAEGRMGDAGVVQPLNRVEKDLWQENAEVIGPYLLLKQPSPGVSVRVGGSVEVAGVSEPGAAVTVNGQPQTLKLQKRFSTTVTAPDKPGPLQITCEAKDRRGLVTRRVVAVDVTP